MTVARTPTCHPDRKHEGYGLCRKCYRKKYESRALKRGSVLKHLYGLSAEMYEAQLRDQGGVCAICRQPCPTGRRLAVDHDHETNRNRGLLCANCNRALGLLQDQPSRAYAAGEYLLQWKDIP